MSFEVGIKVTLPIKTRSPNGGNPGSRWAAIAQSREKKAHRALAHQVLVAALVRRQVRGEDLVPVLVTMTRVSPGRLDDDNVAFALKATRDGIADALGIDDGDTARIRFRYAQRKGERGVYAVEVLVEHEVRSKSEYRRLLAQGLVATVEPPPGVRVVTVDEAADLLGLPPEEREELRARAGQPPAIVRIKPAKEGP